MNRHPRVRELFLLIGMLAAALAGVEGFAQQPIEISRVQGASAILIEPSSGQLLYEQDADRPRSPASIAKLMLELIVVERIAGGELTVDDPIRVSGWASRIGGSQAYLAENEVFRLEDLMKAITIASANDACAAVAEHVAGSCEGFVDLMNQRARQLGLTNTHYVNVHGLDDQPSGNVTTARDISTIARQLISMPHVLEWSQIPETPFRNGTFLLHNTNKLLGRFPGLDGLKTGYTARAGWCLCATAERDGLRLISVVMGADSERLRFSESARLLGSGFAQLRREVLAEAGKPYGGPVPVAGGSPDFVAAQPAQTLALVLPRGAAPPQVRLVPLPKIKAPVAAGDTIGVYEVPAANGDIIQVQALAAAAVKRANLFQRVAGLFRSKRD